jgi:hypothetical protein
MVVAAALVSLVVLGQAEPQSATPEQPPAYTLSGVRRAGQPSPGEPATTPTESPSDTTPPRGLASAAEQQLRVESNVSAVGAKPLRDDRLITTSLAPMGTAWHQEFIGMTQPAYGSSPLDPMGNFERVQAVASSAVFAFAIDAVTQLVTHIVNDSRTRKATKLRKEIDAERLEAERAYAESPSRKGGLR